MSFYFAVCRTEMYQQKYLEFLLEHHDRLHLPYSFPVAFSFLASPVLMGRECFLCFNGEDEVVGAFGYIHGTGERDYEDMHVLQIQVFFLLPEYRGTLLFIKGLQFMTQHIAQLKDEVEELRFWTPADDYLRRLFAKVAEPAASRETVFGGIDEYRVPCQSLLAYTERYRQETYF